MNWKPLAEMPSTQLRILISIILAVIYVILNMIGQLFFNPARRLDEEIGYFILGMMIPDVAQYAFKRFSYKGEDTPPPPSPDREDSPALDKEKPENLG